MKNGNSKIYFYLVASGVLAFLYLKNKNSNFVKENQLTIENYVNRLKEYDLSPEKHASNLFYDLIECGFCLDRAFEYVQREINDNGEYFQ